MTNDAFSDLNRRLKALALEIYNVNRMFENFGRNINLALGQSNESGDQGNASPHDNLQRFFNTKEEVEARAELNALAMSYLDTLITTKSEKEKLDILNNKELDAEGKKGKLFVLAVKAIQAQEEWEAADEDARSVMLDKIETWAEKTVNSVQSVSDKIREYLGKGLWEDIGKGIQAYAKEIGKFVGDGFDKILNKAHKEEKKRIEDDLVALKESHEEKKELLDEEMQAKLYALGLVGAATTEQYENELQKAIATGDEKAIYEAEQALGRHQIEVEYAEKQKELDKEIADEEKKLKEDLALEEWRIKLKSTIASAAQSIVVALATSGWPLNLPAIGFAAAGGAIQIAAVAAQKPEFATGGIVPGINFTGDKVPSMLNSREGVFTLGDQEYLFDQIQNRKLGGGPVNATLVVMLDSREIAKSTIELVNDGFYTIKARALR